TPKSNKKTPKKVNAKETPLKKDESTKAPKKVDAKASMKKVESEKTPKTVANIQKFGGNTPKQGKLHQQKTPQKDSKSPQSVLNIPKAPNRETVRLRVFFPNHSTVRQEDVLKVFKDCENVCFDRSVMVSYNTNIVSKKVQELKKLNIGGVPLIIDTKIKQPNILSRRKIWLKKQEDKEKVKKFYNPKSIEMLLTRNGKPTKCYVLTFETEKEALAASEKTFNLNNKNLFLTWRA
ncbi:hypothetical protein Anas_09668, partial [Armadillidium nasatum]